MKQCSACKKEGQGPKPLSDFNKNRSSKDGLQDKCKEHTRQYCRKWAKANPEKNRAKGKRFRENNKIGYRALSVRANLKKSYGLSETAYQALFDAQLGKCVICQTQMVSQLDHERVVSKGQGYAANNVARVDHDHSTGEVRGLLCFSCNVGLGKFQDNVDILSAAIRYLRRHPTKVDLGNRVTSRPSTETIIGESESEPCKRYLYDVAPADERPQSNSCLN